MPERFNIGDKTRDEQQVARTIANHLIGNMDIVTFNVVSGWDVSHVGLLRDKTARRECRTSFRVRPAKSGRKFNGLTADCPLTAKSDDLRRPPNSGGRHESPILEIARSPTSCWRS